MSVTYLDDDNPDGTCLGQDANAKISFWGATPAIRQAAPTDAATLIVALTAMGLFT